MTNKSYMRIIASRNETATQTQNQEGRRGPMNAEEKVRSMGTKKMLPMILGMSVPAVCGNIVNALYNIVDRIFVGQIVGRDALGAVGLVFPLNNITAALTIMMSIGSMRRSTGFFPALSPWPVRSESSFLLVSSFLQNL